jgi:hypothetical protein
MTSKQLRIAALAATFIGGSATIAYAQSGSSIGPGILPPDSGAAGNTFASTGSQARAQAGGTLSRSETKTKIHKGKVSSRSKTMAH